MNSLNRRIFGRPFGLASRIEWLGPSRIHPPPCSFTIFTIWQWRLLHLLSSSGLRAVPPTSPSPVTGFTILQSIVIFFVLVLMLEVHSLATWTHRARRSDQHEGRSGDPLHLLRSLSIPRSPERPLRHLRPPRWLHSRAPTGPSSTTRTSPSPCSTQFAPPHSTASSK